MPNSKSSTSNETESQLRRVLFKRYVDTEDYKALLAAVLAEIHRDGGQYTILSGFDVSAAQAVETVRLTRRKLSSMMFGRRKP